MSALEKPRPCSSSAARLGGIAADLGEAGVQRTDLLALVGSLCGGERTLDLAQLDVAIEHELQCRVGQRRRLLCDVADHPRGGHVEVALLGVQRAGEQREERGFTAAIAAGEMIFQPGPSCRGGVVDEGFAARAKVRLRRTIMDGGRRQRRAKRVKSPFYRLDNLNLGSPCSTDPDLLP